MRTLFRFRFDSTPSSSRARRQRVLWAALAAAVAASAACGHGADSNAGAGGAGRGGPPPGMPVEIMTLTAKPIEQSSEFVGTIKSRHSISIQPQVEGFLTRIAVKSGDQAAPGTVLMEIDAASQQAVVATLQSQRAAREADAEYASQQAKRAKSLLDVGAGSQQESEQATAALKAAEAQLKALDDQIRQQQNELRYYKVTAPTAGIVGDIPVRQGDRVTRSSVLTTIDDRGALELYLSVPVQQAPMLRVGLPVRLLDDKGQPVATERVTFVAPSVDDKTQTVLAKAGLTDRAHEYRPDQQMRARVIWNTQPGLTVPIVAINRVNGQYFAFVAEKGPQGGLVARQRPVTIGAVVDNEYVVLGGLKAGDQLINGGIQKIGDGMPVMALPGRSGRAGSGHRVVVERLS